MGHKIRVTQRILECGRCGRTPDNGEYLWCMLGDYWCANCVGEDPEEVPEIREIPEFAGTRDALQDLGQIRGLK